jgi:hypothetical protein
MIEYYSKYMAIKNLILISVKQTLITNTGQS